MYIDPGISQYELEEFLVSGKGNLYTRLFCGTLEIKSYEFLLRAIHRVEFYTGRLSSSSADDVEFVTAVIEGLDVPRQDVRDLCRQALASNRFNYSQWGVIFGKAFYDMPQHRGLLLRHAYPGLYSIFRSNIDYAFYFTDAYHRGGILSDEGGALSHMLGARLLDNSPRRVSDIFMESTNGQLLQKSAEALFKLSRLHTSFLQAFMSIVNWKMNLVELAEVGEWFLGLTGIQREVVMRRAFTYILKLVSYDWKQAFNWSLRVSPEARGRENFYELLHVFGDSERGVFDFFRESQDEALKEKAFNLILVIAQSGTFQTRSNFFYYVSSHKQALSRWVWNLERFVDLMEWYRGLGDADTKYLDAPEHRSYLEKCAGEYRKAFQARMIPRVFLQLCDSVGVSEEILFRTSDIGRLMVEDRAAMIEMLSAEKRQALKSLIMLYSQTRIAMQSSVAGARDIVSWIGDTAQLSGRRPRIASRGGERQVVVYDPVTIVGTESDVDTLFALVEWYCKLQDPNAMIVGALSTQSIFFGFSSRIRSLLSNLFFVQSVEYLPGQRSVAPGEMRTTFPQVSAAISRSAPAEGSFVGKDLPPGLALCLDSSYINNGNFQDISDRLNRFDTLQDVASACGLVISGEFVISGRTIRAPLADGRYLVIKAVDSFLAPNNGGYPEQVSELAKEAAILYYAKELGLNSGVYPELLFSGREFDSLGSLFIFHKVGKLAVESGSTMRLTRDHWKNVEARFAIAYVAPPGYFTYLDDPAQEANPEESLLLGIVDRVQLLRRGIYLADWDGYTHNHQEGRRFSWSFHRDDGGEAGQMPRWMEGCRWTNWGKSGLRDLGHARILFDEGENVLTELGNIVFSAIIICGANFWKQEDYPNKFTGSMQGRFRDFIRAAFFTAYREYNGVDPDFLDDMIDWDELSLRLSYEMGSVIRQEIFLDNKESHEQLQLNPGYAGQYQRFETFDLGYGHGPFPCPELIRALWIMSTLAVYERKARSAAENNFVRTSADGTIVNSLAINLSLIFSGFDQGVLSQSGDWFELLSQSPPDPAFAGFDLSLLIIPIIAIFFLYHLSNIFALLSKLIGPSSASKLSLSPPQSWDVFRAKAESVPDLFMSKGWMMFFGEAFADPITDKGEIAQSLMRGNFFKGFNLRQVQAQRDKFLFRPSKIYFYWLKFIHELRNTVRIPEFAFFFQGLKFWYAFFHSLLSPFIKPAFRFRHRPGGNHFNAILSQVFKYYRQITPASGLPQGIISIIFAFQNKWAIFKTNFFYFFRLNPVPGNMRNSIFIPFNFFYPQSSTSIGSIIGNTIDVKKNSLGIVIPREGAVLIEALAPVEIENINKRYPAVSPDSDQLFPLFRIASKNEPLASFVLPNTAYAFMPFALSFLFSDISSWLEFLWHSPPVLIAVLSFIPFISALFILGTSSALKLRVSLGQGPGNRGEGMAWNVKLGAVWPGIENAVLGSRFSVLARAIFSLGFTLVYSYLILTGGGVDISGVAEVFSLSEVGMALGMVGINQGDGWVAHSSSDDDSWLEEVKAQARTGDPDLIAELLGRTLISREQEQWRIEVLFAFASNPGVTDEWIDANVFLNPNDQYILKLGRARRQAGFLLRSFGIGMPGSKMVSIGPGALEPYTGYWQRMIPWERLGLSLGADVVIFEPNPARNFSWRGVARMWPEVMGTLRVIRPEKASFQHARIKDSSVDVIVIMSVLVDPYISNPVKEEIVAAIGRVLRPGGHLIVGWYTGGVENIEERLATEAALEGFMRRGYQLVKDAEGKEPLRGRVHAWAAYRLLVTKKIKKGGGVPRFLSKPEKVDTSTFGKIIVRLAAPLRSLAEEKEIVFSEDSTVKEVIDNLVARYPGIRRRILNAAGRLSPWITIFLNGEEIKNVNPLTVALQPGYTLTILPVIAGGAEGDSEIPGELENILEQIEQQYSEALDVQIALAMVREQIKGLPLDLCESLLLWPQIADAFKRLQSYLPKKYDEWGSLVARDLKSLGGHFEQTLSVYKMLGTAQLSELWTRGQIAYHFHIVLTEDDPYAVETALTAIQNILQEISSVKITAPSLPPDIRFALIQRFQLAENLVIRAAILRELTGFGFSEYNLLDFRELFYDVLARWEDQEELVLAGLFGFGNLSTLSPEIEVERLAGALISLVLQQASSKLRGATIFWLGAVLYLDSRFRRQPKRIARAILSDPRVDQFTSIVQSCAVDENKAIASSAREVLKQLGIPYPVEVIEEAADDFIEDTLNGDVFAEERERRKSEEYVDKSISEILRGLRAMAGYSGDELLSELVSGETEQLATDMLSAPLPGDLLRGFFEDGARIVFVTAANPTISFQRRLQDALFLREAVGLSHLALPLPASQMDNFQRLLSGVEPSPDFFIVFDLAMGWYLRTKPLYPGYSDKTTEAFLSSMRELRAQGVSFIFFGAEPHFQGELAFENSVNALSSVLSEDPASRILVYVYGRGIDWMKYSRVSSKIGPSYAATIAQRTRFKVASVIEENSQGWRWSARSRINNLDQVLEVLRIARAHGRWLGLRLQDSVLAKLKFDLFAAESYGQAWDGLIFNFIKDDDDYDDDDPLEPPSQPKGGIFLPVPQPLPLEDSPLPARVLEEAGRRSTQAIQRAGADQGRFCFVTSAGFGQDMGGQFSSDVRPFGKPGENHKGGSTHNIISSALSEFIQGLRDEDYELIRQLQRYAYALEILEKYLADSGKVTGPPVVAYYDPASNEIVYNLSAAEIEAELSEHQFSPVEIAAVEAFIQEHEEFHQQSPSYSEGQVFRLQALQISREINTPFGWFFGTDYMPGDDFLGAEVNYEAAGTMVYPASGLDVLRAVSHAFRFSHIRQVVLVDPLYALPDFLSGCLEDILRDAEAGGLNPQVKDNGLRVILTTPEARTLEIIFTPIYYEKFSLNESPVLTLVHYPGIAGEMSLEPWFWDQLLEQAREGGYIIIEESYFPEFVRSSLEGIGFRLVYAPPDFQFDQAEEQELGPIVIQKLELTPEISVSLGASLRRFIAGQGVFKVEGRIVREVIANLDAQYPGLRGCILDKTGQLQPQVAVFVNGKQADLFTSLKPGDTLTILPAIAGGATSAEDGGESRRNPLGRVWNIFDLDRVAATLGVAVEDLERARELLQFTQPSPYSASLPNPVQLRKSFLALTILKILIQKGAISSRLSNGDAQALLQGQLFFRKLPSISTYQNLLKQLAGVFPELIVADQTSPSQSIIYLFKNHPEFQGRDLSGVASKKRKAQRRSLRGPSVHGESLDKNGNQSATDNYSMAFPLLFGGVFAQGSVSATELSIFVVTALAAIIAAGCFIYFGALGLIRFWVGQSEALSERLMEPKEFIPGTLMRLGSGAGAFESIAFDLMKTGPMRFILPGGQELYFIYNEDRELVIQRREVGSEREMVSEIKFRAMNYQVDLTARSRTAQRRLWIGGQFPSGSQQKRNDYIPMSVDLMQLFHFQIDWRVTQEEVGGKWQDIEAVVTLWNRFPEYITAELAQKINHGLKSSGEEQSRAPMLSQASTILNQFEPFQIDLELMRKRREILRNSLGIDLVEVVQVSLQEAGFSDEEIQRIVIEVVGSTAMWLMQNQSPNWQVIGDVDILLHIPEDIYANWTRLFFTARMDLVDKISQGIGREVCLIAKRQSDMISERALAFPYGWNKNYFGAELALRQLTQIRNERLISQRELILKHYLYLFNLAYELLNKIQRDDLDSGVIQKFFKCLLQLAQDRGDINQARQLFELIVGLAEESISIKEARGKTSELLELSRPEFKIEDVKGLAQRYGARFLTALDSVALIIPGLWQRFTQEERVIRVGEATTIGEAITGLITLYPGIRPQIINEANVFHPWIAVFVNDQQIPAVELLATPLKPGDALTILPAMAGGAPATVEELVEYLTASQDVAKTIPERVEALERLRDIVDEQGLVWLSGEWDQMRELINRLGSGDSFFNLVLGHSMVGLAFSSDEKLAQAARAFLRSALDKGQRENVLPLDKITSLEKALAVSK